ncbi:MAG TPA: hypothetical protein VKU19_30685 [Bryobacteraceae bacterium]|nr:hypothetical protein [Bryobacteraceae bacterium]
MKRLLLVPALAAALCMPAGAQCVMCYRSAHSQNDARARVLNWGILILGAPPFLILAGFCAFVFKKNEVCGNAEPGATADWLDPVEQER